MTAQQILDGREQGEIYGIYDQNRWQAANLLELAGFGEAKYLTQWSSGTTAWQVYDLDVTVKADGTITGLPEVDEPQCSYWDHEISKDGAKRTVTFTMPSNDSILAGVVYRLVCYNGLVSVLNALVRACKTCKEMNAQDNMSRAAKDYKDAQKLLRNVTETIMQYTFD